MTTAHPISLEEPFRLDTDHFVGYHDVCPWSPDNHWLLAHSATLDGGLPGPDDEAEIVVVEHSADGMGSVGDTRIVGRTRAWNWQLGARAQWLPVKDESLLVFNRRAERGFGSAVVNIRGEPRRDLPFPVYAVGPAGRLTAFVDYGRLHRLREGYGYRPTADSAGPQRIGKGTPAGLHLGHLESGSADLLLTHREIVRRIDVPDFESTGPLWIEHPTFSPSGGRVAFLLRARTSNGGLPTRLVVTDPEGDEVRAPELAELTHYAWLDDDRILAWGRDPGSPAGRLQRLGLPDGLMRLARRVSRRFPTGPVREQVMGDRFRVIDLAAGTVEVFRGAVGRDGHPATCPGCEVVLLDTYPDEENRQRLYLVDPASEQRMELGRWAAPQGAGVDRCDLHPRWDRAGQHVCFDSAHTGQRCVYTADIAQSLDALKAER